MSKKDDLLKKLCRKPSPKNFTTRELDALMRLCDCEKFSGGRGSGIGFVHNLKNTTIWPASSWKWIVPIPDQKNDTILKGYWGDNK